MSLSDTRTAIAQALETTSANVYDFPPSVIIPPAIIIAPADTYVEIATIGNQGARVIQNLRITCAVAPIDNEATLDGIEQLIQDVLFALPTSIGFQGGFSRPQTLTTGTTELIATDLTIQVMTGLEPEPTPPESEGA